MALGKVGVSVSSSAVSGASGQSANDFGGLQFGDNEIGGGFKWPSWPVMAGAAVVLVIAVWLWTRE